MTALLLALILASSCGTFSTTAGRTITRSTDSQQITITASAQYVTEGACPRTGQIFASNIREVKPQE